MKKLFLLLLLTIGLTAGDYENALAAYKHKNYTTAKTLFEKSAKRGNPSAQYYLGKMHDKGQGISRDRTVALKWYKKAEKNGDKLAKKRMNTLRHNTKRKGIEAGKTITLLGLKITLDIAMFVDAPTGGDIIYSVQFRKGSHKKKDFTDDRNKETFEFLNYRIKFYNIGVEPKVTVTKW